MLALHCFRRTLYNVGPHLNHLCCELDMAANCLEGSSCNAKSRFNVRWWWRWRRRRQRRRRRRRLCLFSPLL